MPAVQNISAWYTPHRDKGNVVVVQLYEYTEDQIELFRNTVLDSPFLVFEEAVEPPTPMSN